MSVKMPPKITLDTNCLIDVEEQRLGFQDVLYLRQLHDAGKVNLRLVAASASDKRINGALIDNFFLFSKFVESIGFDGIEVLPTIAILGFAFVDYCIVGGGEATELYYQIGKTLFPGGYSGSESDKTLSRNQVCDVLMMWSHVRYNGDVFVSRDDNFRKQSKRSKLIGLGAGEIMTPHDAVTKFQ